MPGLLAGKRVVIVTSNTGVERDELIVPRDRLREHGAQVRHAAVKGEPVHAVTSAGNPIAAICHGPWLLVETAVVAGRTLTSYPSLRTDIVNAGAAWADESVVRDSSDGWSLITSRNPGDLPDFVDAITEELSER
ncbi:DJ-1/PfpI family protein [Nocardia yamanashiensis]|uniref:DJ-1/PfpI family protein n=1 Tax=Nocardia yamanashiensis TaxID=209247 RepID=UPI0008352ABF|nr:DJ-1/PfpI family protein [Nocardia yamanashiensis]